MKTWFKNSPPLQSLVAGIVAFYSIGLPMFFYSVLFKSSGINSENLFTIASNQFFLLFLLGVLTGLLYHFSMSRVQRFNHFLRAATFWGMGYFLISFQGWENGLGKWIFSYALVLSASQWFAYLVNKWEKLNELSQMESVEE